MGSNNRSTRSTRKRKLDSYKKKQVDNRSIWIWGIIFALAVVFTLPSFFKDYLKEILTLYLPQIGVGLITVIILVAAWDFKIRRKQKAKQKRLLRKLRLQRKTLSNHFDAQKDDTESLNLALLTNEKESPVKELPTNEEKPPSHLEFLGANADIQIQEVEKNSQELEKMKEFLTTYKDTHESNGEIKPFFDNIDNIEIKGEMKEPVLVDGEDVSSFSDRWQKFFKDHEGKSSREKLNAMLQYEEE